MARSMTSRVTLALRAFSSTAKSRALPAGSPPPSLAATVISFTSLPTDWPFLRLTIARFACSHWRPIGGTRYNTVWRAGKPAHEPGSPGFLAFQDSPARFFRFLLTHPCQQPMLSSRRMIDRCPWAAAELQHDYHDTEWGAPSHDDRHLFEMLILEGAQAGLSWATILARRETYREAYDGFDPAVVAAYEAKKKARLLKNPGIIRNRLKVEASVLN